MFTKAQLRQIMNIYETEISLDASNMRVGGRPAVLFHDPHLLLTSRSKGIQRVGWNIMRGVKPHSPLLATLKTSLKTMSSG